MTDPLEFSAGAVTSEVGPAPAEPIVVVAYGTPATQGSKKHVGNGVMIESSKRTRPWREAVKQAALDAMLTRDRLTGPVSVVATFAFDRPRAHYRTGRNAHVLRDSAPRWPCTRSSGDVDKLLRAVLDALVDGFVLRDDAQVVNVLARKVWAGEYRSMLVPGADIFIAPLVSRRG